MVLAGAFCFVSCQVKRPDTVLPDARMEAILYDYHLAKTMGEQLPYNEAYKRTLYIESVFKKHGITQAEFDTSMVWMTHHPDVLRDIYEKINERLKIEKENIDNLIAIHDNKPKESKAGDSIDVWAWPRVYQLTGMPFDNKMTFNLPSDPNFQPRDTLRWQVRFLFPEGHSLPDSSHCPVMAMQIFYEKDSIISTLRRIYSSGVETLSLSADTLGKIERIYGFVYDTRPSFENSMLLIDKVSLMRYHAKDSLPQTSEQGKEEEEKKEMKREPAVNKKPSSASLEKDNPPLRQSNSPLKKENMPLKKENAVSLRPVEQQPLRP